MTVGFRFESSSTAAQGAIFPFERVSAIRPEAANADVLAPEPVGDASEGADVIAAARDAIVDALARVQASETFRQSRRHRLFLEYLVLVTLDGRRHALKEVVIGLEVFGRRLDGYDPKRDSIVRVEARRLRDKLARYYAQEGADDRVMIRLSRGSYVPDFVTRSPSPRTLPTLTVSRFATTDGDARLDGFAQGLADLLIDRLRAAGGRRIDAHWDPRGPADGPASTGLVLGGSLVRHGTRTRCIVHLTSALRRTRVWSDVFDFDAAAPGSDLFAFQDRVADAVVDATAREIA